MTHPEFVGDWLRLTQAHLRGDEQVLDWSYLQPSEQSYWRKMGQAALDADASWRPRSVNVVR